MSLKPTWRSKIDLINLLAFLRILYGAFLTTWQASTCFQNIIMIRKVLFCLKMSFLDSNEEVFAQPKYQKSRNGSWHWTEGSFPRLSDSWTCSNTTLYDKFMSVNGSARQGQVSIFLTGLNQLMVFSCYSRFRKYLRRTFCDNLTPPGKLTNFLYT